ncbi:MAG TPA: parallel beta-helix domain-containing protein [Gemmatimonadales bacterium]|nr:parallel beta-helix domain-containing protein [Gemmatimonadales bacterium]
MFRARLSLALIFTVAACQDAAHVTAPPEADRGGMSGAIVPAGGSIQSAIDAAAPGAVIQISAGTYHEALTVAKPRITLVGRGTVVIENPGDAEDGIDVEDAGDGFVLANVTVRGFDENGVKLDHVNVFLLYNVRAEDDGEYGLFPVFSSNGVIQNCSATGHSDTGIYVGQSHHVLMVGNVASGNVNGLEIENSSDVLAVGNESFDNVAGILVVLLPGLDVKTSSNIFVRGNRVHDNNHVNFATPGEIESFVPSGAGILVVGTDRTSVVGNIVTGNQFTGIAVGSTLLLGALAGLPPEAFADIEPNPDGARILGNTVTGNGGESPIPFLPAVDLLWDGSGIGNCWRGNTYATSVPDPLPAC